MKVVLWQRRAWQGALVFVWLIVFLIVGVAMLRERQKGAPAPVQVEVKKDAQKKAPNPFAKLRLERERTRDAQLEALTEAGEEEAVKVLAGQKRMEGELEGILKTMGFAEAVVLVGSEEAQVVVAATLEEAQVMRIGELVAQKTGFPFEKITISEGSPLVNAGKSIRGAE